MDRPVRKSRQRSVKTDVLGLLPQEEAAINRALYESLLQEKKTPPKEPPSSPLRATGSTHGNSSCLTDSARDVLTATSAHTTAHFSASQEWSHSGTMASMADQREGSTERDSSGTTSKTPYKRRRLRSPISPSHSIDSSNFSMSSSPAPFTNLSQVSSSPARSSPSSVDGSLKLVLSPSSWSHSTSSSHCSPSPEPAVSRPQKTPCKVRLQSKAAAKILRVIRNSKNKVPTKVKHSVGRSKKTLSTNSKSVTSPGMKKKKSTAPKGDTMTKNYTKASLKFHKKLSSSPKLGPKKASPKKVLKPKTEPVRSQLGTSSELDQFPMSPEMARVMHDHCYSFSSTATANLHQEMSTDDRNRSPKASKGKCSTKSNPSSSPYQAQRKFAQNQVPVYTQQNWLSTEEVENVSTLKEVPKTDDFITFLCLRGSDRMPNDLEKFAFPWTQQPKRKGCKNGQKVVAKRKPLPFVSAKGGRSKSSNVYKKLDLSVSSVTAPE